MNRKEVEKFLDEYENLAYMKMECTLDLYEEESKRFKEMRDHLIDLLLKKHSNWVCEADLCIGICPKCHSWNDCEIHDKENWICKKCDIIFSKVYFP
jgi:hypothetical protein